MKVYVVEERGEYEGSSIVGVFSTLARAEHFIETTKPQVYDHRVIDEYEVDKPETQAAASA